MWVAPAVLPTPLPANLSASRAVAPATFAHHPHLAVTATAASVRATEFRRPQWRAHDRQVAFRASGPLCTKLPSGAPRQPAHHPATPTRTDGTAPPPS